MHSVRRAGFAGGLDGGQQQRDQDADDGDDDEELDQGEAATNFASDRWRGSMDDFLLHCWVEAVVRERSMRVAYDGGKHGGK